MSLCLFNIAKFIGSLVADTSLRLIYSLSCQMIKAYFTFKQLYSL